LATAAVNARTIANGAVTLSKIAPGVIRDIGITVIPFISHNQTIPVPTGFDRSECIFFAALKSFTIFTTTSTALAFCIVDDGGRVITSDPQRVVATGIALAKKGGWG
jgi:hypothetical protein